MLIGKNKNVNISGVFSLCVNLGLGEQTSADYFSFEVMFHFKTSFNWTY